MEQYALNLFNGLSQRVSYRDAGYGPNSSPTTLDRMAFDLANHPKIVTRLEELRKLAQDDTVAEVKERKQRLTEFIRGSVTHYMDDGGTLVLTKTSPHSGAVAEWQVKETKYGQQRHLKLHDPIQAISELNRMERIYEVGAVVNQDNRQVNIYVMDEETKQLLSRVGERTLQEKGEA